MPASSGNLATSATADSGTLIESKYSLIVRIIGISGSSCEVVTGDKFGNVISSYGGDAEPARETVWIAVYPSAVFLSLSVSSSSSGGRCSSQ
jgi:hypothetical protein